MVRRGTGTGVVEARSGVVRQELGVRLASCVCHMTSEVPPPPPTSYQ